MRDVEIRYHRRDDREYSSSWTRLHNDQKRFNRDFSLHFCSDIRSLTAELSMTLSILRETISLVRSENCTLSVRSVREKAAVKIDYKWMTIASLFKRLHRFYRFDERSLWIWEFLWDNLSSSRIENQSQKKRERHTSWFSRHRAEHNDDDRKTFWRQTRESNRVNQ
jgi:hypothetical protein